MGDPAAETAAMIANMPAKTGRSLDEWLALVGTLGLAKHGQVVSHLKSEEGLAHGFAHQVALRYFDVSPKKTVVALRRAKQFAQIQPATKTRIDLGLNLPGVLAEGRLQAMTGMCTRKVAVT